ncbi:Fatty acid amide hydrolase [Glycine soja]|uniref:Fatty acid amide hydrolase n=1 Tax=Glycine soja TaxID=3848 RepID=A0A0B2QNQ0_GLYSO|nr:Fatty acid amide hydrolase [Glycine soja]
MQVRNPYVKLLVAPKASTVFVALESRHSIVNKSLSSCPKHGVHNPFKAPQRYLMFGAHMLSLPKSPPCLPTLSSNDNSNALGSLRIGKYTPWFNDVHSTEISDKCDEALNLLSKAHGCEMIEIIILELLEMRTTHVVSIGSECLCSLNPGCEDWYV